MEKQNNTTEAAPVKPLAVRKRTARSMLGDISDVSLWRLERRGLIKAIPGLRHKLYSVESLERFAAGKAA